MGNPKDFSARQIRTSQLIASGGIAGTKAGLIIYSASINAPGFTSDLKGGFPASLLDGVGEDVYVFVSGSKNSKVARDDAGNGYQGVTLFGGDVVFSGTMYADKMVVEVDLSSTGSVVISGSLFVSQSAFINQGLTVNNLKGSHANDNFTVFDYYGTPLIKTDVNDSLVGVGVSPTVAKLQVLVKDSDNNDGVFIDFNETGNHNALSIDSEASFPAVYVLASKGINIQTEGTDGYGIDILSDDNRTASPLVSFADEGTSTTTTTLKVSQHGTGDILNLYDGSTEVFTVTNGGNVGIGISNPNTDKVHIVSQDSENMGGVYIDHKDTGTTNALKIESAASLPAVNITSPLGISVMSEGAAGYGLDIASDDARTSVPLVSFSDNDTSTIQTTLKVTQYGTGDILNLLDGSDEVFTVTNGGNVGIGTDTPSGVLDVRGSTGAQVFILSGSGGWESPHETSYTDLAFFVSGSVGSRGTTVKGAAVFGGDLIVSGGFVSMGTPITFGSPIPILGTDVNFFVTGTTGTKDSATPGTAMFAGDLVVSGATHLQSNVIITGSNIFAAITDPGYSTSIFSVKSKASNPRMLLHGSPGSIEHTAGTYDPYLYLKHGSASGYSLSTTNTLLILDSQLDNRMYILSPDDKTNTINLGHASNGTFVNINSKLDDELFWLRAGTGGNQAEFSIDTTNRYFGFNIWKRPGWADGVGPKHLIDVHGDGETSKVYMLSGSGGGTSHDESNYTDVAFFVSGSINSRNKGTNGSALFGGDTAVSGTLYVDKINSSNIGVNNNIIIEGSLATILKGPHIFVSASSAVNILAGKRNNQYTAASIGSVLISGSNDVSIHADKCLTFSGSQIDIYGQQGDGLPTGTDVFLLVSGTTGGKERSTPKTVTVFGGDAVISGSLYVDNINENTPSGIVFRNNNVDKLSVMVNKVKVHDVFVPSSDNSIDIGQHTPGASGNRFRNFYATSLTVDSQNKQVLILSGGGATSKNEAAYTDTGFFVSGSIGSRGTSVKGTAVFGGDVVISGTLHGGSPLSIGDTAMLTGAFYLKDMASPPSVHSSGQSVLYSDSGKLYFKNAGSAAAEVGSGGEIPLNAGPGWKQGASVLTPEEPDFIYTTGSIAISGSSLHVAQNIRHIGDTTTRLRFDEGRLRFFVGETTLVNMNKSGVAGEEGIFFNTDGANITTAIGSPFKNGKYATAIGIPYSTDQVLILSGGGGTSFNEATASDVSFYVSGSTNSRGTSRRGSAVFGGDLIVSGAVAGGESITLGFLDNSPRDIIKREIGRKSFGGGEPITTIRDIDTTLAYDKKIQFIRYTITGKPSTADRLVSEILIVPDYAGAANTPALSETRLQTGHHNVAGNSDYLNESNVQFEVSKNVDGHVILQVVGSLGFATSAGAATMDLTWEKTVMFDI